MTVNAEATVSRKYRYPVTAGALPSPAIVTSRLMHPGEKFHPGTAALTIDGRPLLVFPGRFPFYRDLKSGDRGIDVAQLQRGLAAAGYAIPSQETGIMGRATEAAIGAIYRRSGFDPPPGIPHGSGSEDHGGAVLPLAEIATVGSASGTVASLPNVGQQMTPGRPIFSIHAGPIVALAKVTASIGTQVRVGQRARLWGDDGVVRSGKVIAWSKGTNRVARPTDGGDALSVPIQGLSALKQGMIGQHLLVAITLRAVTGPSMVVPTRAIDVSRDQHSYILVRRGDDLTRVAVRQIGSLAGRTAVVAVAGHLSAGDQVEVSG
jgi:hypothetical protein